MEMMSRVCPLCGSSDTSTLFAEADFTLERLDSFAFASRKMPEYMHYRLVDCPGCDLLYANPMAEQLLGVELEVGRLTKGGRRHGDSNYGEDGFRHG